MSLVVALGNFTRWLQPILIRWVLHVVGRSSGVSMSDQNTRRANLRIAYHVMDSFMKQTGTLNARGF